MISKESVRGKGSKEAEGVTESAGRQDSYRFIQGYRRGNARHLLAYYPWTLPGGATYSSFRSVTLPGSLLLPLLYVLMSEAVRGDPGGRGAKAAGTTGEGLPGKKGKDVNMERAIRE